MSDRYANLEDLVGKTMVSVERFTEEEELVFTTTDGDVYKLLHVQDCCENVYIEDVEGDLLDLVGEPLTIATENSNSQDGEDDGGSTTWTFYKFATRKGYVDVRWCGSSNGYYSEGVHFVRVTQE